MTSEEDMDALAKKLLFDDAAQPSDAVWTRLEAQLPAGGGRLLPLLLTWYAKIGIALLVLVLAAVYFWLQHDTSIESVPKEVTQMQSSTAKNKAQPAEEKEKSALPAEQALVEEVHAVTKPKAIKKAGQATAEASIEQATTAHGTAAHFTAPAHAVITHEPASVWKSTNAHPGLSPFEQVPAAEGWAGILPSLAATEAFRNPGVLPAHPTLLTPISPSGKIFKPELPQHTVEVDYGPRPRQGWFVGAFADVRSTSLRINRGQEGSNQLVDSLASAESASVNMGTGITFGYNLSPKWRISSGFAFAKWCRTTRYPVLFSVSDALEGLSVGADVSIPLAQNVNSATGIQTIIVNAPSTDLAEVTSNIAPNASLSRLLAIEECYDLIQLPFMIEYQHYTGRLAFLPGAGLTYEHALRRSTRLLTDGNQPLEGTAMHTETARRHFLSFVASLHLEYMVTSHFSVRAGTNYKTWITPLYQSDLIKTYPRLISLDAGVVYTFNRRRL
jgi:hypothetical protein